MDATSKSRRGALIRQTRDLLTDLVKRYLSAFSLDDQFPSLDELNLLRTTAGSLYCALGRMRPRFDEGWKTFGQVEARYPSIRLTLFCRRLMTKLETAPIGPLSRITQKIASLKSSDNDSAKKLIKVVEFLDQASLPSLRSLQWRDYYVLLLPFVSTGFEDRMIQKAIEEREYDRLEKTKPFYEATSWFLPEPYPQAGPPFPRKRL